MRWLLLVVVGACGQSSPPAAVAVPPPSVQPTVTAPPTDPPAPVAAPRTWTAAVDTSLGAPDAFHLVAISKDGKKVLARVMTTVEYFEKHTKRQTRGNSEYMAELELATGCMETTFDFPTLGKASSTGTVEDALAVLNSPEMATDLGRARAIAAAYGPNDTPIRISPDGHHVVLEANNELYHAVDNAKFARVGNRAAMNPVMSANGRQVLFAYGGGAYLPNMLDLASGKMQPVTRAKGASMTARDIFPTPDGNFLVAEEAPSQICISKIDSAQLKEAEQLCIPSRILSSSIAELSDDGKFIMLHAERPDRVVVWDTANWQKVTDAPGSPIYAKLDGQGRVAWDDPSGTISIAKGQQVEKLALKKDPNGLYPRLAGFLGNKMVLGHPAQKAFNFEEPLVSLKDTEPCGWLTVH
jgi:hypothetical protein